MSPTIERFISLLGNFKNNDFIELLGAFGIETTGLKSQLQEQAINLLKNTPTGFDCQAYLSKIVEIYSKQYDILKSNNDNTHTMQIQQQNMLSIGIEVQHQKIDQFPRQPTHKTKLGLEYLHLKNIAKNTNNSFQHGLRQSVLSNVLTQDLQNQHTRTTAPMDPIGSKNNAVTSGYTSQQINDQSSQQPIQLINKIRPRSPQVMSQKQKTLQENNALENSSLHHGHQQFVTCNNVYQVPTNQQIRTTAPMDPIGSKNNVVTSGYNIKVKPQQKLSSMHTSHQTNNQFSQKPKQPILKIQPRSPQVMPQKQKDFHGNNIVENSSLQQGHWQPILLNIASQDPKNQHNTRTIAPMDPIGSKNNAVTSGYNIKVKQQEKLSSMHTSQQINDQSSQQPIQLINNIRPRSPQVMSQKQKTLQENNILENSSLHHGHQQFVTCNNVYQVPTNQQIRTTAPMDPIGSKNNAVTSGYNIKVKQQEKLSSMHTSQEINDQSSQQPIEFINKIRPRSPQVMSQKQKTLQENNILKNSSLHHHQQFVPTNQQIRTTALMDPIGSKNNAVTSGYNIKVKQQQKLSSMHTSQQTNYQSSQKSKQPIHNIRPRSPQVMPQKQKDFHGNNIVENSSLQHGHRQSSFKIPTNQGNILKKIMNLGELGCNAILEKIDILSNVVSQDPTNQLITTITPLGTSKQHNIQPESPQISTQKQKALRENNIFENSFQNKVVYKVPTNLDDILKEILDQIEFNCNADISGNTINKLSENDKVNIFNEIANDYYAKKNIDASLLHTEVYRYNEKVVYNKKEFEKFVKQIKKIYLRKFVKELFEEVKTDDSTVTPGSTVSEMNAEALYGNDVLLSSTQKTEILARIKFKKLPFYEDHLEVIKPISLIDIENVRNISKGLLEGIYNLSLSIEHTNSILVNQITSPGKVDFGYQIFIRICQIDTMSTEVTDYLPLALNIQINDIECPLPPTKDNNNHVGTRRIPSPINCTHLLKLSPVTGNKITISWFPDGKNYVMAIFVVKKLNSNNLLKQLLDKEAKNIDETIDYIIKKFESIDSDLATTSISFSLLCPLSKIRMKFPAKSIHCNHLQCFDANTFLLMNEQKPTWVCPTCNRPCLYDDIQIQTYFLDVVTSSTIPSSVEEIELLSDGTWTFNENIVEDICIENIW